MPIVIIIITTINERELKELKIKSSQGSAIPPWKTHPEEIFEDYSFCKCFKNGTALFELQRFLSTKFLLCFFFVSVKI